MANEISADLHLHGISAVHGNLLKGMHESEGRAQIMPVKTS